MIKLVIFFAIAGTSFSIFMDKCPVNEDTPTYYPHEYNCSQFYQCSSGILYLMSCPGDLYFNPKLNVCDRAYNVDCVTTTTKITTTTTSSKPTTNSPTEPEITSPEPTTSLSTESETTSTEPSTNISNEPEITSAEPTITPSTESEITTPAPETSTASPKPSSTKLTTTTTKSPETTTIPSGLVCEDDSTSYVKPHPTDCQKYISCDHGTITIYTCPTDQLFDKIDGICKPKDMVVCTSSTSIWFYVINYFKIWVSNQNIFTKP